MKTKIGKIAAVVLIPCILFLIFTISAPGFGIQSMTVILCQSVTPIIMGYGMAFGMSAGLFDLSVGSRVLVSASIGGYLALRFGLPGLILGCVVSGILISVIMGAAFNVIRIPSLVLSLGCVMLLEVLSYAFLGKASFIQIPQNVAILGSIKGMYIICAVMIIAFYILYYRTKFSFHVKAIGQNEILASNMGIKPKCVYFMAFLISGIFIGIASILQISYPSSISATMDMGSLSMVFKPMMGVMIGMELLPIIDNLALNIILGELCLSIIFNGLIAIGLPSTMQDVVLGAFMLIVMGISANSAKFRGLFKFGKRKVLA